MESCTPVPLQTTPQKRSHDGQPVRTIPKSLNVPSPSSSRTTREQSPALSAASSSLSDPPPSVGQAAPSTTASEEKPKKRKLTFAEREVEKAVKKAEREAKEKLKAEERARKEEEKIRKEEEKRVRDEEKRRKEEEKEAARRERELGKERKRQAKEAEKKAKDDEKTKKEKSQLRIGAFFGRPAPASTPPSTPEDLSSGYSSRRSSIAELDIEKPQFETKPSPIQNPEYEKLFPSFFVFENTDIAPTNRFFKPQRSYTAPDITSFLSSQLEERIDLATVAKHLHRRPLGRRGCRSRGRRKQSVREIVDHINGTSEAPVDLTLNDGNSQPMKGLEKVPVKFLSFQHPNLDLQTRPPYQGTYTRQVSPHAALRMPKNPFHRGLPETNYDYDSEVEWEPLQEGDEDINLEDEESEEEGDEEEMADFLDDENDVGKRRVVVREMEPVSSGLCWNGSAFSSGPFNMEDYRMDVLDDAHRFPIDPYSTNYWTKASKQTPQRDSKASGSATNSMQPPRLPLSNVNVPNVFVTQGFLPASKSETAKGDVENVSIQSKYKSKSSSNKTPKLISDELLPAFKQAVSGSDLTKAGLIEVLKKQFPKVSKDTIKDTLSTIAVREGVKEVDKKWILIS